jgi:tryptophanyl-tRNA synthetase
MQKLFSGIKPTGTLHLGNYFGAMRQFVSLSPKYNCMFMVADYHSINSLRDPQELRANIIDIAAAYISIGIDPTQSIIFKQSDVPEHTELTWVFNSLVSVSFLMQAHAYKDAVSNGKEANMGLFDYPMLMASDILLYDTDIVPVGKDQQQHVEYAREAAAKFNNAYGETFKEPQEHILETVAVVPGTDGRKMSKSYGNTIPLFGTKDEIAKAVMSIVTDSKAESPENVYAIHSLFRDKDDLAIIYTENKGKYKALKEALIEDIEAFVAPMREIRTAITDDDVRNILREGGERARSIASKKMADVRAKLGITI